MKNNYPNTAIFDYTFLGLGCGNSLLLLEMERNGLLTDKTILIIEPTNKAVNDKTFCFWLKPHLIVEYGIVDLIEKEWSKVCVGNEQIQTLGIYKYYHIPSLSLYNKVKNTICNYNNVTIHESYIGNLHKKGDLFVLGMQNHEFYSRFVFDNRPPTYSEPNKNETQLFQSFYGWEIETVNKKFDSDVFTMMDFEIPQDGSTQFMYVLPYDEKRALFEITRFGEKILEREEAELSLHVYLSSKEIDFSVVETERGVIRMFDSNPIDMQCETNLYNTGERGGSLKPSTGYSFIRSLEHAREITSDLMANNKDNNNKQTRFSYYDRLLLQVLKTHPLNGKEVFRRLFTNNKVENVLRFLDENSTRKEEIKIFKSLPIKLFILVAIKDVSWMFWNKLVQIPFVIWMSLFTLLSYSLVGISFVYVFLFLGMVLIGIPHGALDHLYSKDYQFRRNLTFHIIKYVGLGLLVLLLFWISPLVGLIFFLLYSSWHFGEADFLHWKIKNNLFSFVWGIYFLGGLLISHYNESQLVIREMFVNLTLDESFSNLVGNIWILVGGFFFLFWNKNRGIFYGVLTLILLKFLPLIPAFAVFFIGQHSIHGWTSLRSSLKETNLNLWLKALPFSLGAILLLPLISFFSVINWGQIFIFFASLSFPHVFFTSKVLKNWQK